MAKRAARNPIRIAITVASQAWLGRVPDARVRCRKLVRAALAAGGFDGSRLRTGQIVELSLVLGDDALLQRLNREFRGKDKPTNVLSFPAFDAQNPLEQSGFHAVEPLGDVAIAYETTACEAREQGKTLAAHLSHLVVHGVLHVLGYDHLTKAQATDMETLETAVLARFGFSDPYRASVPREKRRQPSGRRRVPHHERAVSCQQPRAARSHKNERQP